MKIFSTSGALYTLDRDGKRVPVKEFTAPTDSCDCGIFCCGEKSEIKWYSHDNSEYRKIDLDALYDLVNA